MKHPLDRVARVPRTCVWEITRRCNLRCIHCENDCGDGPARELSFARIEQVAAELAALGCHDVEVTGGEPLMRPDWDAVCRALRQLGLRVALITNGTLLDQSRLDRALDADVGIVAVSLDGLQATHDRIRVRPGGGPSPWRQAVAAIERAAPRLETMVITAVNRRNLTELRALRACMAGLGVRRWQVQLVIPMGRALAAPAPFLLAPSDLEALTELLVEARADGNLPRIDVSDTIGYYTERELALRGAADHPGLWTGCQAGIRAVAITYDGRVRGCSMMPPEFDAGDLHGESMTAIWNDARRFAYSTHFDVAHLAGPCRSCRVGGLCRAGCTTMAYWTTGSIYSNPFCLQRARGVCA